MNDVLLVIIYILLAILLVVSIIFVVKLIHTLTRVDTLVDDIALKSSKLDGIFNIIDRSTDTLTVMSDKFISFITTTVVNLFNKKKKKGEDEDE